MTAPFAPSPSSAAGGLHLRRCVRHPAREAAARCPACGGFFCRECVVEHDGRLLCTPCLAKITKAIGERRRRWTAVRRGAMAAAGAMLLWICFATTGSWLLKIPPAFHDGTVWKSLLERSGQ
jgi:sulfite exporter TauE/SafE